jgi:phospholipid/cholesterol/gamma-HCH transport system substrate-binding protein
VTEAQRERALKFRVGIFVIVAVLAFLGTIYALGARAHLFESRYTIHADFVQVGGLVEGATVRLAGVQIGRVSDVSLAGEAGGKVRVSMSVATQYANRIRKNSVARIATQGLLGDRIVEISMGTAQAPPVQPGEVIPTREPFELADAISQSAETIRGITALADALRQTAETLNQSGLIEDASATVKAARGLTDRFSRITDQIEKGRGWAHALLYDEPAALRRLNDTLASTQTLLDRIERGEGAAGVLTSPQSTEAAKRLVSLMDRLGRLGEPGRTDDGLLTALLFDPKYRAVLDDLRETARNLRTVSDRVVGGRGTLGSLVKDDGGDDGSLRLTIQDLQVAVANLKEITAKINEGEGTLGALVADPTLYEKLVAIVDGAQRSSVLRFLIRGLSKDAGKNLDKNTGKDGRQ